MKPRAIVILLALLIIVTRVSALDPRDYLIRGGRGKDTYDTAIRRILRQGWQKDVVLRYVHIPPFEKELVVGIRRVGPGYRAFVLEPSSHIWSEEVKRIERKRPDFSHIQAVYKRGRLAKRMFATWLPSGVTFCLTRVIIIKIPIVT